MFYFKGEFALKTVWVLCCYLQDAEMYSVPRHTYQPKEGPLSHDDQDPNHRVYLPVLSCIVCHKRLGSAYEGEDNHPDNGVVCHTCGNYGSTIFDEVDGHYLEFNICDNCLKKAREQKLIALGFPQNSLRIWTEGLEDEWPREPKSSK